MLFSDSLPDAISEHPNVSRFSEVLNELHTYKKRVVFEALRVHNPSILTDRKWLLKQLQDYGVEGFPLDYPIQVLQQYLLNINTICSLRGSAIGLELFCSVLSLGEVTVDDSQFFNPSVSLFLDSPSRGFLSTDNSVDTRHLFLIDDSETFNPRMPLDITIKSKFFSDSSSPECLAVKKYIETFVGGFITFSSNSIINITFQAADNYYFHELLNPHFV